MATAKFIYDSADKCPDIYYASGFAAPDAFIYFETKGKKYLVMSDLEVDRAKKSSKVHKVLSLSKYAEKAKKKFKAPTQLDVLDTIFKDFGIKKLEVPDSMGFPMVDGLRKRHYKVVAGPIPFYPERLQKTPAEKKIMTGSQDTVFAAIGMAEKVLRSSTVRKNCLYYKGKVLTSESLRSMINVMLMERGFIALDGTIVACGKDAMDPHNEGSGPLHPHQSIIVDIYPRSLATRYCGDATRTFCVGKAPEKLARLYDAVKKAQEYALKNIKAGINGRMIHEGIHKIFKGLGYETGEKDGRMQGFFHSTGHGIGLEVHEPPTRIGPVDMTLKEGLVVSVEPGLYYKGIGGVRIEDLVYVTKNGCEILSGYPKKLEIR